MANLLETEYYKILELNNTFDKNITEPYYEVAVLSNITMNQIKEVLEFSLRDWDIPALANIGDYDNILQDSLHYSDSKAVIVFWELANITKNLHYKINSLDAKEIDEFSALVKKNIDFVLKNLAECPLLIFNKFSSVAFTSNNYINTKLENLCFDLNHYLESKKQINLHLIDTTKILCQNGVLSSIDFRKYYSSKILYKPDFLKRYCDYIRPIIVSSLGKSKKCIVFDCDNTLWGGILGEDGFNKIKLSENDNVGKFFNEVQNIVLDLNKIGIIVCLCSKNNSEDVDKVLSSHPDMVLSDDNLTIKKINWENKALNLIEISRELNIGLDSIVFVDDSDFEINLIKSKIPEIELIQVPEELHKYPNLLRDKSRLFFNLSRTDEDSKKIQMYKEQSKRSGSKDQYSNLEDYLISLGIKLELHIDKDEIIPRISQMTQKTNQFNLTTVRYTEKEVEKFVESENYSVLALSVSDKFGDNGVTALTIIELNFEKNLAVIDTLLLSCRIIGRNIEYKFMDLLFNHISQKEISNIQASYFSTKKNNQVSNFYDKFDFEIAEKETSFTQYFIDIKDYKESKINYIEVLK